MNTKTIVATTSERTRYVLTRTMSNASVARVVSSFDFNYTVGVPVSLVVRFTSQQLEKKPYPTGYIQTTGFATASRAAQPYVLAAVATLLAIDGTIRRLAQLNDGTSANRVLLNRGSTNAGQGGVVTAGVSVTRSSGTNSMTGARRPIIAFEVGAASGSTSIIDGARFADVTLTPPLGLNRDPEEMSNSGIAALTSPGGALAA